MVGQGLSPRLRGIGGIVSRCNGRQFRISCDDMSRLVDEQFFQQRGIPVVISTDLRELDPGDR